MGLVHAAEQASLQRTVAVKVLREEARTEAREAGFVREARVTGALEHPNVVPVHALGRGEDGAPMLIMKRVVGRSWLELMEETRGAPGHLDRHLDVLLAVCNAVELAHDRGVLHRDLKPENVLVGDYGEVRVVDWGLAMGFGDAPAVPGMAHARGVQQVVGTPRYMAPEMATADGAALGPATDVYLLGAVLHQILTGRPRHEGTTLMAMLYAAYASEPVAYGEDVPAELAAIANRACHAEPASRYPDVASLRRALLEFRSHAGSAALAEEARRRLDEGDDAGLAACRFGFEQALAGWPDDPVAREGLADSLERMADRALDRNALDEAQRRRPRRAPGARGAATGAAGAARGPRASPRAGRARAGPGRRGGTASRLRDRVRRALRALQRGARRGSRARPLHPDPPRVHGRCRRRRGPRGGRVPRPAARPLPEPSRAPPRLQPGAHARGAGPGLPCHRVARDRHRASAGDQPLPARRLVHHRERLPGRADGVGRRLHLLRRRRLPALAVRGRAGTRSARPPRSSWPARCCASTSPTSPTPRECLQSPAKPGHVHVLVHVHVHVDVLVARSAHLGEHRDDAYEQLLGLGVSGFVDEIHGAKG
ncbi:MAG TPA: serine/threonine-protein kinase, partial [Sandaracinaceae bacterium LLY-WYZ-13_1]|nr:serine/threonine-protein kinase [Sandaracinaceae bacterium LLY-WYZ-13_1]